MSANVAHGRGSVLLVTGAAGMVGSYLSGVFSGLELYRTDLRESDGIGELDVRDCSAVMVTMERVRPHVVYHLAAETDVDLCEREPDHAYRTNTLGALNVALACQRHNAELVYVSTAGVFDGAKSEPYTEFDEPRPISVYAKAKLEGEKLVQTFCPRHYIVRAGWMFGGKDRDKKFVGKITQFCMEHRSEIQAVDDKVGSPTYAEDLLKNVQTLTQTGLYGLYHVVNTGACSRYDVAVEIAQLLGSETRIVPVESAMFPCSAPRPRSEAARSYKLDLLGMNQMRSWQEALREYIVILRDALARPEPLHAATS
jgi:dTDP-4-dehydrorhamnose reductase